MLALVVAADNGAPALGFSRAAVAMYPVSPAAAIRARAAAAGWHLPAAVPERMSRRHTGFSMARWKREQRRFQAHRGPARRCAWRPA